MADVAAGNDGPWREGLADAAEASLIARVRADLECDEGRVPHAYQDHLGFWTIGVGHLIDQRKGGRLPGHIIDALLAWDVRQVMVELDRTRPWWRELHENARAALIEMGFQLGVPGLLAFRRMWDALAVRDYAAAEAQALDSKWGKADTPARAARVAAKFREV